MFHTQESYQQLVDELTKAQQKITQLEAAHQTEVEIQQRAENLAAINQLAAKLAAAPPDTDIFALIADTLKTITGAFATGVTTYLADTKAFEIKYVSAGNSTLTKFNKLFGRNIIGFHVPVPPEMRQSLLTEVVSIRKDLSTATFGAIPTSISTAVQKIFHIGYFLGLAFHDDNELMGSAVIAMPEGQPPLPEDLLKVFARVAAVSMRRKQAEEALRESEIRFDAIVQNSSDIIVLLNADGTLHYVSPSIELILGYGPQDFLGSDPFVFVHPDDLSLVWAKFNQALQHPGSPIKAEFRLRHTDGTWVSFETLINSLLDVPEVEAVIVNARDITERKRAEAAILQASRLETATTLAGGIAHRVNNLMTAAIGYTDLLQAKLAPNSDALPMLKKISEATHQTSDLAQQMVAFARGGKYELQVLDLNQTIKESLAWQYASLPVGIHLDYHLAPDLWPIEADPTQMRQVALNLLTNAIEAIESTGTIIVTTENILIDKRNKKRFGDLSSGSYICLSVVDTGHGMSAEILGRVLEPFFTTKFQGRGMGLAAVYGIVKNHDGYFSITSQPEKGTTCQVYLPVGNMSPSREGTTLQQIP